MKAFIYILLISYVLSLYSSNSTIRRQLFNLTIYGKFQYNGNYDSLTVLDLSGFEEETIHISYYVRASSFDAKILNYEFADDYPDNYFECTHKTESIFSQTTANTGRKSDGKITSVTLFFDIEKQNKRYLVLENPLYQDHYLEVYHHKKDPSKVRIVGWIIGAIFCILFISYIIYTLKTADKKTTSQSTDNKKETPSPLYPPNQTYDSTQANTIEMQQQPPYAPQPIPPESTYSNDTGYSSGMGQQDGYSSGMGQQGYYSGMGVQPS